MQDIRHSDFAAPTLALMTKSKGNLSRASLVRASHFEKRDAIATEETEDPSIDFGTDVRRKKARKKGESIIKLAFYSAEERIKRARVREEDGRW